MKIEKPFRLGFVAALGVALALLLVTMIGSLATVLTYIGVAFFVSLGLAPAVAFLVRRRFPKWAALVTVVIIFLAVIVGVVWAVLPSLIEQTSSFIRGLPDLVKNITTEPWFIWITQQIGTSVDLTAIIKELTTWVSNPANLTSVAGGLLNVGVGVATGVTGTIIVVILTLYFTASLDSIKSFAYSLVPRSTRDTFASMTEEITGGVGKYVVGQIALAALNGVLCFIVLVSIGGKAAVVWAFVAFLLALIPLIGTVVSSVVVSFSQLLLASPLTALVILIYFLIYMQIEAYVISPRIMNKAVSIPGSAVVIAALAGGTLLGVLGALVAIPIAASIILIIKQVVVPRMDTR